MVTEVSFTAHWTAANTHLISSLSEIINSPHLTPFAKLIRCIKQIWANFCDFLFRPLNNSAKNWVVGGLRDTEEEVVSAREGWVARWEGADCSPEQAFLKEAYQPITINATTPDGVPFIGTFYRSRMSYDANLPTILCPNPNLGGVSRGKGWDWLLRKGAKSSRPFNVIVFDYACGALQGGPLHSPKDLTLNADTFYQFAQYQGVHESNIHFFGFCTGAQVMATVAAMHPNSGRLASLNSTYNLAELLYHSPYIDADRISRRLPVVTKDFIHLFFSRSRWALDVREELNEISPRACFMNHIGDIFVTPEVHCSRVIAGNANTASLSTKSNVTIIPNNYVPHWLPPSLMVDEDGLSATKKIVNFLLGEEVFKRGNSLQSTKYTIPKTGVTTDLQEILKEKVASSISAAQSSTT